MLKARGIKPGPLYARIKAGQEIEAPDGSVIKPQEVVGPTRQGRKIGITFGLSFNSLPLDDLLSMKQNTLYAVVAALLA